MTGTNDFHVIGYTNEQILEGGIHRLLALDAHILKNNLALNSQLGPLINAEARGIVAEEPVEVYSIMRAVIREDNRYDESYQEIVFLNDVALRLCRVYKVRIPPVTARVKREDIPNHASVLLKHKVYTPKTQAGIPADQLPAFNVGDYVRPRGGGATMGTVVGSKVEGGKYFYHFMQDPRFQSPQPPVDEHWPEDKLELWQRPTDAEVNFINKIAGGR